MAGLTLQEEIAQSIPTSIAYEAPIPVAGDFAPGDIVQLLRDSDGEPTETALGSVEAVLGTALKLGTKVYDAADGWGFSLVSRPMTLPQALSEIDATLIGAAAPARLMGKALIWTTEDGIRIPADQILSFVVVV